MTGAAGTVAVAAAGGAEAGAATTTGAAGAAAAAAGGAAMAHPLQCAWSMWYTHPGDSWEPKLVTSVASVEQFWCLFNNLQPPSRIPVGSNFHFFKQGIEPQWEDPQNAKGGKWTLELSRHEGDLMDSLWLWTLLALIGEYFAESRDVTGVVVSPR